MRITPAAILALVRSDLIRATLGISLRRASGQALVLASTVICTRFFAPADFGTAGLVFSAASIIALLSSLRLETHILRARRPDVRQAYLGMAYGATIGTALAALAIVSGYAVFRGSVAWHYLLVPISALLLSVTQYLLPAQFPETDDAHRIGKMSLVVSAVTAVAQLAAAFLIPSAIGLIVVRIMGMLTGLVFMRRPVAAGIAAAVHLSSRKVRRLWRPAVREFVFASPASIVSLIGFQSPVYLFALLGQHAAAGIYWFAFSLIFMPYFIVASSLRPLLLREMSGKRLLIERRMFLRDLTLAAVLAGLAALLAVVVSARIFIEFALSAQWQLASPYAGWLGLLIAGVIVTTPILSVLPALRQQQANLVYNILQLTLRAGALLAATAWTGSSVAGIAAFSIVGFVLAVLYCLWTFARIGQSMRAKRGSG